MDWVFNRRRRSRGQSLAEFALVFPVMIAILGGIVQFGMIFWAQNTLTQVVRDTGRWAATQSCSADILGKANSVAGNSSLIGYSTGMWTTTGNPVADDAALSTFDPGTGEGVAYTWVKDSGATLCPPKDNQSVYHVSIKIVHSVPVFFPGMQYLPGFAGNKAVLSSSAQFRMEPNP